MSVDLQMARGNVEGGFNLAVGEPEFLQNKLWFGPLMDYSRSWPYPTIDGSEALINELQLMYPNMHIVVTNGAKQALLAAMYAYKKTYSYLTHLYHEAPHWPSYPTLAEFSGLEFTKIRNDTLSDIWCLTAPNNPDGSPSTNGFCDIWDAVYASMVYGWNGLIPDNAISVYSAAKLLGLSGLRLGWLVTDKEIFAEHASNYVEFTTSGVALPSQKYVAEALFIMREQPPTWQLEHARKDLLTNGDIFNRYLGDVIEEVHGIPNEGVGMFAWFKVKDPYFFNEALDKAKIKVVSGPACGGSENHFRMSMGLTPDKTEIALKTLRDKI